MTQSAVKSCQNTIIHYFQITAIISHFQDSRLGMHDEIFTFKSFTNFVNFLKIFQDPFFEIFIEILYFNYNSLITRKNVSQV